MTIQFCIDFATHANVKYFWVFAKVGLKQDSEYEECYTKTTKVYNEVNPSVFCPHFTLNNVVSNDDDSQVNESSCTEHYGYGDEKQLTRDGGCFFRDEQDDGHNITRATIKQEQCSIYG